MRNILLSEYYALVSKHAAIWGAEDGADVSSYGPRWPALLGGLSVNIELRLVGRGCMKPVIRVGSSSTLPGDAHQALVFLIDQQNTLQRALSCFFAVDGVVVYPQDCPCDYCGSTGKVRGSVCSTCDGTGMRQEKEATIDL